MSQNILRFKEIDLSHHDQVGGKNSSLGEMFRQLVPKGVRVPDGFATTASAYRRFLEVNEIKTDLQKTLDELDTDEFSNLHEVGKKCRQIVMDASLQDDLKKDIIKGYEILKDEYGDRISLAVRSSATAEDLPEASFAGQQETFLNVRGNDNLFHAVHRCFASLFTDRAIKYRVDNDFPHMKVALSAGVQLMVRSDKACSGVLFSLEPDSGFEDVVFIAGAWGLGENVVQGTVNTDEFMVFKPLIDKVKQPVISKRLGSKLKTMIYSEKANGQLKKPEDAIENVDTPEEKQFQYILKDEEIVQLAKWSNIIEEHYERHMDVEWAKDGESGELFVVQARPETVHSIDEEKHLFYEYKLKEKGEVLTSGIGMGNKVVAGKARILDFPKQSDRLEKGEILVTKRTDPDWDPILKKASAIITDSGGRTSHAAIVAREVGAVAVVGCGDASKKIKDGDMVTVSTAEGDTGFVYEGKLDWEQNEVDISGIEMPRTKAMLILAHPDQAFRYSFLPNDGVGLLRMEFIINNAIGIHPMALKHFDQLNDEQVKAEIAAKTRHYKDKSHYFVCELAQSISIIAAAFYPKPVIVRMSDFKSNEYANLIGGKQFEPEEENPMLGFRGASRYYHEKYKEGFALECEAMKVVREDMGFDNVKLMIPFCRTVDEGKKVIDIMADAGLKQGEKGLQIYMMVEIPSNAVLAHEFAKHFDGFSIGSNDLTQLTLGADRDSDLLSKIFDPFDPAVMELIRMSIEKAREADIPVGLCGQAPSDYPAFAKFLVECGITSISFNPDALIRGIENINKAEKQKIHT